MLTLGCGRRTARAQPAEANNRDLAGSVPQSPKIEVVSSAPSRHNSKSITTAPTQAREFTDMFAILELLGNAPAVKRHTEGLTYRGFGSARCARQWLAPVLLAFLALIPPQALALTAAISSPPTDVTIYPGDAVNFSGDATPTATGYNLAYQWTFPGGIPSVSMVQDPGPVVFPNPGVYGLSSRSTNT